MPANQSLHEKGVAASGKRSLAKHVSEWHGTKRNATPYALLVKWSKDELLTAHAELHESAQQARANDIVASFREYMGGDS